MSALLPQHFTIIQRAVDMFPKAPETDTFQDCLMQSFFTEWSANKETYSWNTWDDMIAGMSPEEIKGIF